MRSALEWAQVRALAADGVSQREIACRLGINRRTVARLLASEEPPCYRRAPVGSQLDPLEPVLRRLLEEWPQIKAPRLTEILRCDYGYRGSLRLVQARLRELRPVPVRPAQRTGYRPGQVLQLDWAEMPTRPRLAGRERRVYALIASLPYSGAQTAFFSLDMTIESFLEERSALRALPPARFDSSGHRMTRVPIDGYLRYGGCFYRTPERLVHERVQLCFDRDEVWIVHRGIEVARYERSYEQGVWLPPPIMRPEPPSSPPPLLPRVTVAAPELAAYAELCT